MNAFPTNDNFCSGGLRGKGAEKCTKRGAMVWGNFIIFTKFQKYTYSIDFNTKLCIIIAYLFIANFLQRGNRI